VAPGDLRLDANRQLAAYVDSPPLPAPDDGKHDKNGNGNGNGNGKEAKQEARQATRKTRARAVKKRPPRPPPPRKHKIVVVDFEGRPKARFPAVQVDGSDEPPRDLRFLVDGRLLYEVTLPPPAAPDAPKQPARPARRPARAKARGKAAVHAAADRPAAAFPSWFPAPRLFVIQPVSGRRTRPQRCDGVHFALPPGVNRLAFVGGKPDAAFVSVDGAQAYPRRGRTIIASNVAWSKDGTSVAFLETPPAGPARLVLLAEPDNPTGDTVWPLPASLSLDGARVFWAGRGRIVVGKSVGRPLFATSFVKEKPFEP
jgi:hypothetical protein